MKIDLNNVIFEENDMNHLKDCIFNVLSEYNISDEEAMEYWKKLPDDIKIDALKYGISDTPTRENIYTWLQENREQLKKDSDFYDKVNEKLSDDIWKKPEKYTKIRIISYPMTDECGVFIDGKCLFNKPKKYEKMLDWEDNFFNNNVIKTVNIPKEKAEEIFNSEQTGDSTILTEENHNMNNVVIKYGFIDEHEFFHLISNVDISTSDNFKKYKDWQENDGTKEGLLKLNH